MRAKSLFLAVTVVAAVFSGCTKFGPTGRQSQSGQGGTEGGSQIPVFTLVENKDWVISYDGRVAVAQGKADLVSVSAVPSNMNYLLSVINRESYASYEGDLEAFMKDEYNLVMEDPNYTYVYQGPKSERFDVFRHGTWYAFVMGLDSGLQLTGEYAYIKFTVDEETPDEAFTKWLGTWKISGGKISYNLTVSSIEANYVYRVDGWETGEVGTNGIQENMDQEYLETFFYNGSMYFTSLYIQSYEEGGQTVDELFLGEVDYDGVLHPQGLYVVPDEGYDLAAASFSVDVNTAVVNPTEVIALIEQEEFPTVFYDMKYFGWTSRDGYMHYNDEVAPFPLTMERTRAEVPVIPSVKLRGAAVKSAALRAKRFTPHGQRQIVRAVKSR